MLNNLATSIHAMIKQDQALPKEQALEELQSLLELPSEDLIKRMAVLGPLNWFAVPANTLPKPVIE